MFDAYDSIFGRSEILPWNGSDPFSPLFLITWKSEHRDIPFLGNLKSTLERNTS